MQDILQIDYLEDEKTIKINLPEKVLDNINTIVITRLGENEIIIERENEV
jgi:hypothetical protein